MKIFCQSRGIPAQCRSARLRAYGYTPEQVKGIESLVAVTYEPAGYSGTTWAYITGNNPENAVYAHEGDWTKGRKYFHRTFNDLTGRYEISVTERHGMEWKCEQDLIRMAPGDGWGWEPLNPAGELCDCRGTLLVTRTGEEIVLRTKQPT